MNSIDWTAIGRWIATTGLQIVLIILLSVAAYVLLTISSRIVTRKIKEHDGIEGSELDRRAETIRRLVKTTGTVLIIVTATLMILDRLGIDIRPILASVGVLSLAVGLGAQTLVKDVIGGIFIIVEDQFNVDEVIEFGDIVGTVEDMTLRATKVRDANGTLYIIPNDELRVIANRTRGWSRATVDITVPYTQNVESVYEALENVKEKAQSDVGISGMLVEELSITGIEGLEDWGLRIRITGKTKPNDNLEVQRFLRAQIMEMLKERSIDIAQPWQKIELVNSA
jgi:small conductance mechanosensitive channel